MCAAAFPPPRRGDRIAAALAVGMLAAAWTTIAARSGVPMSADFGVAWRGAQMVVAGLDPYAAIGPGRRFPFLWPLVYPMPAVLVDVPLAWLSPNGARAAFAGLSFAAMTYGLSRRAWWPLLALVTPAARVALWLVQWSGAVVAAATVPVLGWLVAAKPNLGLAVAASWQTRRQWVWGAGGAGVLVALSFAIAPHWVEGWLAALRTPAATYVRAPVMRPGGALLLLALLRWRRPEARLLAALALVPHTAAYYDLLLLFVIPASALEAAALCALTWAAFFTEMALMPTGPTPFADEIALRGRVLLALCYLPCLLMILPRPNVGDVPTWAERWIDRWIEGPLGRARRALARRGLRGDEVDA